MQTMRQNSGHLVPIPDVICHQQIIYISIEFFTWHLRWYRRKPIRKNILRKTDDHNARKFRQLRTIAYMKTQQKFNPPRVQMKRKHAIRSTCHMIEKVAVQKSTCCQCKAIIRSIRSHPSFGHVHPTPTWCLLVTRLCHIPSRQQNIHYLSDFIMIRCHQSTSLKEISRLLGNGYPIAFQVKTKRCCKSANRAALVAWSLTTTKPSTHLIF